jgi:peptidoglycan hydrolase-like protein with peptidoglycan-binding domain
MPKPKRVVPFGRRLGGGEEGLDVNAIKRGLAQAGFGELKNITNKFGPGMVANLKAFQKHKGIEQSGRYGPRTHKALVPHFDARAAHLYTSFDPTDTEATKRRAIVAAMLLLYNQRNGVHYTQSPQRMQGVREKLKPPKFPTFEDCSSSSTWAYYVAGAPDPNGLNYNGQGWTGTLCRHGKVVQAGGASPGDLVFYGAGPPWGHVAVYIGNGKVISHGSEKGPYLLPMDYRMDRGEIHSYL